MARHVIGMLALCAWTASIVAAQLADSIIDPAHPAIEYGAPLSDRVSELNRKIVQGETRLEYEGRTGYLPSLLGALDVPVESQIALFSATSLQARLIHSRNPRTIFFNDSTTVAWMAGGFIEIAVQHPRQGAIFYLMPQQQVATPQLARDTRCLQCHYSTATLGVPGFLARSVPSAASGAILPWLGNYTTDHRSPISERWGGWYVTGRGGGGHLGNHPLPDRNVEEIRIDEANLNLTTLAGRFDTGGYLSAHSDIVALLVFDHQMHMMNLLTRLQWRARILAHEGRTGMDALRDDVNDVVDYMLFVDEAPLEPVRGISGFAERFAAAGPRDSKGRSLRDFDLEQRLFRYPCSYMIYSEAFDALPSDVRRAVYERMWNVLSEANSSPRYARLSRDDRQAIVEILRETKRDLGPAITPRPFQL